MSTPLRLDGAVQNQVSLTREQMSRARFGTALAFFLTGAVSASLAARTPALKAQLDLSNGQLALAFLGLNVGAMAGLPLGAALVPRIGSRQALAVALPLYAAALVGPALTPTLPTLTAAFLVLACANAVVDVAMNAHGVEVERHGEQPMLSGFHAWHSLGGIAGAIGGALAAHLSVALLPHFLAVAITSCALGAAGTRLLLPASVDGSAHAQHTEHPLGDRVRSLAAGLWQWSGPVALCGGLAFAVVLAMASATNWSAVYLHDALGASPTLAAVGFGAYSATMTVGRLVGDRLTVRFGPVPVFRAGALLASGGLGAGLLVGVPITGILGFALLGAGLSITFPLLLSAAGNLDAEATASAVARVSAVGYFGSFVSPVLIGVLAGVAGLGVALSVPVLLCGCAAIGARIVAPAATQHRSVTGRS